MPGCLLISQWEKERERKVDKNESITLLFFHCRKLLTTSFHLRGHTYWFYPLTEKLEPPGSATALPEISFTDSKVIHGIIKQECMLLNYVHLNTFMMLFTDRIHFKVNLF